MIRATTNPRGQSAAGRQNSFAGVYEYHGAPFVRFADPEYANRESIRAPYTAMREMAMAMNRVVEYAKEISEDT